MAAPVLPQPIEEDVLLALSNQENLSAPDGRGSPQEAQQPVVNWPEQVQEQAHAAVAQQGQELPQVYSLPLNSSFPKCWTAHSTMLDSVLPPVQQCWISFETNVGLPIQQCSIVWPSLKPYRTLLDQLIQHCWIQHCSTVCHTHSSNNFCLIKCWMKFDFHKTYCPTNMFDKEMLDSSAKTSTKLHIEKKTRIFRSPITYRQQFT